jgi:predicted HicB family RNase H-like nuclease
VAKGRKAEIKAHAERQVKSINGYVTEAIDEKMERDQE